MTYNMFEEDYIFQMYKLSGDWYFNNNEYKHIYFYLVNIRASLSQILKYTFLKPHSAKYENRYTNEFDLPHLQL